MDFIEDVGENFMQSHHHKAIMLIYTCMLCSGDLKY